MKTTKHIIISLVSLGIGIFVGNYFSDTIQHNRVHVEHHQDTHSDHTQKTHTMPGNNSMAQMMHDMNQELIGKSGEAFDQAFLTEMIIHHQGAVEMAKLVIETSTRPELQKLAQDIITTQTTEISQMQLWQTEWFK